jgi:hypothetical protein
MHLWIHCFSVLAYTRKYGNLSLVTSTEDVVQHFTRASIRKMQLVTESQQKDARYEGCKQETAFPMTRSKLQERYS